MISTEVYLDILAYKRQGHSIRWIARLGNNFWTFAVNDSLYGADPDCFSGNVNEISAVKK